MQLGRNNYKEETVGTAEWEGREPESSLFFQK